MRHTNFAPLYRSFIGFDQLANKLNAASQAQQNQQQQQTKAQQNGKANGKPPYNVEAVAKDQYRITIVVAGFSEDELEIQFQQNNLLVKGTKAKTQETLPAGHKFLHQGLPMDDFERKFQLDDHVKVVDASIENGLLNIELRREVPEAMKPRKIAINGGDKSELLS